MAGSLSIEATKARRAAPFPHQKGHPRSVIDDDTARRTASYR
uniref:Uncharacterized protein n=1 Tax=Anguilla anguilla TaxID=7936 RepID=A0A0E9PBD2_ANGAN